MRALRRGNTNSLGLIDAAQNGDVQRVKAKLKAGKDVNSKDEVRIGVAAARFGLPKRVGCKLASPTVERGRIRRLLGLLRRARRKPYSCARGPSSALTHARVCTRCGDRSGDRCRCFGRRTRATWRLRRCWWTQGLRSPPLTRFACASAAPLRPLSAVTGCGRPCGRSRDAQSAGRARRCCHAGALVSCGFDPRTLAPPRTRRTAARRCIWQRTRATWTSSSCCSLRAPT